MVSRKKLSLESYVLKSGDKPGDYPSVSWVLQGFSALSLLDAGPAPHAHRVYVRADGYLKIMTDVPLRG